MNEPQWLLWARELQAIAQTGLHFSKDVFDAERYEAVRHLAARMMEAGSDCGFEVIHGLFAAEFGYATPKVDVRGAVFQDEKILLVRERSDGLWTLPGGWADVNQSAAESVIREIAEESGFHTTVRKLAAVLDRAKHPHTRPFPFHIYKMFFLCDLSGGQAQPGIETSEVGFFGADEIPPLSEGRVILPQIARMFAHHHQPDLPTEFD